MGRLRRQWCLGCLACGHPWFYLPNKASGLPWEFKVTSQAGTAARTVSGTGPRFGGHDTTGSEHPGAGPLARDQSPSWRAARGPGAGVYFKSQSASIQINSMAAVFGNNRLIASYSNGVGLREGLAERRR